jgi:hexosaminidase
MNAMDGELLLLIPKPAAIERRPGSFAFDHKAAVMTDAANEANGRYLLTRLRLQPGDGEPTIHLAIDDELSALGPEGYRLEVTPQMIHISAGEPAGVFYGIQTLAQLLTAEKNAAAAAMAIPCLFIEDRPRFRWRGFMLDEGRHFQGKETVMRLLEAMAQLKLNIFHWHLTEDQGWRLEIKKYPRLTAIGARREGTAQGWLDTLRDKHDGRPHSGFYSQEEVRQIVAFAAERHITVVPEIEMPGHANAALAAYPEFSCSGGPFTVPTRFGIFKDVYCPGKEATFTYLQDVLDEVMALFPGPYIHIGGDEAPRARWEKCPDCQRRIAQEGLADEHELQLYLTNSMDAYLEKTGRTLVGWNEILNDDLDASAVAQYWLRNRQEMIAAIKNGRQAIISTTWHYYLDYGYSLTSLSKSYNHEPVFAELSPSEAQNVLGIESPLWTEFVPTPQRLGYQAFPRLAAVAESAWTPAAGKDLVDFRKRLPGFLRQLDQIGLGYAPEADIEPAKIKQKLGFLSIIRP